jgi:putative ABC transport system ATP-binding protein
MTESTIVLKDVSKEYHARNSVIHALASINLTVKKGELVALRGASGCGKSTVLLIAGGLLEPNSGKAQICGASVYGMSTSQRAAFRAQKIGFVFQQFHLIPYLNVIDNIRAPGLAARKDTCRVRAQELADRFGLHARLKHLPSELSTGERQRTALARAMFNNPEVILADEPTGNLDVNNSQIILTCLKEFSNSGGSVLLVTHDDKASAYANNVLFIKNGSIDRCNN